MLLLSPHISFFRSSRHRTEQRQAIDVDARLASSGHRWRRPTYQNALRGEARPTGGSTLAGERGDGRGRDHGGRRLRPVMGSTARGNRRSRRSAGKVLGWWWMALVVEGEGERLTIAEIMEDRDGGHGGHWGARERLELKGGAGED